MSDPLRPEPVEPETETASDSERSTGRDYELLDFGDGRKLERFGEVWLDRPSPAAERSVPQQPTLWGRAAYRYTRRHGEKGVWKPSAKHFDETLDESGFCLKLKLTPFGHVGVFPEQQQNWRWIQQRVRKGTKASSEPLRVLNLFAYTGGSTLAAASAGAHVTHVDSAKNVVQWARDNAALSQLEEAPIRWIAEDAMRFVNREVKRGNKYEAIILDPPTYGHGPKGERWRLSTDLMPLLNACAELLSERRQFIVFSCHSPGFGPAEVGAFLQQAFFGACTATVRSVPMSLTTSSGARLNAGVVARWPGQ